MDGMIIFGGVLFAFFTLTTALSMGVSLVCFGYTKGRAGPDDFWDHMSKLRKELPPESR